MDTASKTGLADISVVKIGGRALERNLGGLLDSIAREAGVGRVIVVHGGGDQVTRVTKALGIEPRFVVSPQGIRSRYTSREELEVLIMVMSAINRNIVSELARRGVEALGVAGCDGPLFEGSRKKQIVIVDERGRKRVIEGGYTGRIERCHRERIQRLLELYRVLVISPLVLDPSEGVLLNTDGDEAAASIASCVKAYEAIFVTDVPGVIVDGKVMPRISAKDKEILEKIGAGMNRKVLAALKYIQETGGNAYICDGASGDIFEKARTGGCTEITTENSAL
jgi:acetylglutamate/LysW-gamma-L-alpha-aminoadipate kinase